MKNETIFDGIKPVPAVPLLLLGVPGIGKTAIIEQFFDHTEKLLLSSCVEEDIAGIPYRDGVIARRTKPDWLDRLETAASQRNSLCLFLDEIDKARRAVSDTVLTLLSSRTVGSFALPGSVCIIAAANPEGAGGGIEGLSQPLLSRFCIETVEPNLADWTAWARERFPSAQSQAAIEAVARGRIPLYETHGEGMAMRTTSPRTLAMALELMEAGAMRDTHARGLLTNNAASALMLVVNNVRHDVFETSNDISRKALKSTKTVLRL